MKGRSPPIPWFFSKSLPKKLIPSMGRPSPTLNEAPPLKNKAHFQKMIPGKKTQKSETVINTCVSLIKQH